MYIILRSYRTFIEIYLNDELICDINFNWFVTSPKEVEICSQIINSHVISSRIIDSGIYLDEYKKMMDILTVFYENPNDIFYVNMKFITTMIFMYDAKNRLVKF